MDDAPSEHTGDLDALFAEVNNLPADDPLRGNGNGQQPVPSAANELPSAAEQAASAPPPSPAMPAPAIAVHAAGAENRNAVFRIHRSCGARAPCCRSWHRGRCGKPGRRPLVSGGTVAGGGRVCRRPPAWRCRLWAAASPGSRFPHREAWCLRGTEIVVRFTR